MLHSCSLVDPTRRVSGCGSESRNVVFGKNEYFWSQGRPNELFLLHNVYDTDAEYKFVGLTTSSKKEKNIWNKCLYYSVDISVFLNRFNRLSSLQRSISFRNDTQTERAAHPPASSSSMKTRIISATVSNPSSSMTATRVSIATAPAAKRRDSKLWSETFDVRLGATQPLSPKEIKRQEVRDTLLRDWRMFLFVCHNNFFFIRLFLVSFYTAHQSVMWFKKRILYTQNNITVICLEKSSETQYFFSTDNENYETCKWQ